MKMKVFEVSSTDFLEDKRLINNALSDMALEFGLSNDFAFGEPTSRFGWITCVNVLLKCPSAYVPLCATFEPYPTCAPAENG